MLKNVILALSLIAVLILGYREFSPEQLVQTKPAEAGISSANLPDLVSTQPSPYESVQIIDTFEVPKVKVVPIANGLANPFTMAFRNNGDILITERYTGKLRIVRNGLLLENEILGVPEVYSGEFRAGLMSVAIHPNDDQLVYLTYHKPLIVDGETEQTVALARGRLIEDQLVDVEELFTTAGVDRGIAASLLLFTPDNKLLMSVGGAYVYRGLGDLAQDPSVHFGKLLRLNDDGSVPSDNPFVSSQEYLPEVYSVGHRNQLGLSFHPDTGDLWATENGPQGGDEANIIIPGQNYGWPNVSYSRQYRGDRVSQQPWSADYVDPEVLWWPSIAPSGLAFYSGDKFPQWQGNLFVGSMMEGRIANTGHIERVVFNSRGEEIRREELLKQFGQRVTGVTQGPDGYLYVLIDEEDGALIRLEPEEN